MGAIPRGITFEAGQRSADRTTSQESTHHVGDVELADETAGKETAAAPKAFKTSGQQQHSGGVPIQSVNKMHVPLLALQACDH